MFGYFYPETNERFLVSMSFASAAEAVEWFRDKRATWIEIAPSRDDAAAFMSPQGIIVVVRQVEGNNGE